MRTLITGGSGFLGSHLCDYLLKEGHSVICMDSLLTGNLDNIAHLFGKENFSFIKYDVTNYIYVKGHLDNVLHFASPASPIDFSNLPIQTAKAGALGTHNALGLALAKGARFMLASTSEVYGDPKEHPQREEYTGNVSITGPRAVYDEGKRFAEAITLAYHRYHSLNVRIARIFNTYGPRMQLGDGRVIPAFMEQAINGDELTVFGSGTQTRSFCFYSDMVEGLYKLLCSDITEPINLGNQMEITVLELARIVLELTGSESKIKHLELPQDDPRLRRPDISKARKLLGWEPQTPLEKGLRETIEYYRKIIAEKRSIG